MHVFSAQNILMKRRFLPFILQILEGFAVGYQGELGRKLKANGREHSSAFRVSGIFLLPSLESQ